MEEINLNLGSPNLSVSGNNDGGTIKISMNVKRPQPNSPNKGEVVTEEPEPPVKVDWFGLVFFYLSALLLAIGGWAIYDMYKSKKKSS